MLSVTRSPGASAAHRVALLVVDLLEVVEVQHGHAQRLAAGAGLADQFGPARLHLAAVAQAGELVAPHVGLECGGPRAVALRVLAYLLGFHAGDEQVGLRLQLRHRAGALQRQVGLQVVQRVGAAAQLRRRAPQRVVQPHVGGALVGLRGGLQHLHQLVPGGLGLLLLQQQQFALRAAHAPEQRLKAQGSRQGQGLVQQLCGCIGLAQVNQDLAQIAQGACLEEHLAAGSRQGQELFGERPCQTQDVKGLCGRQAIAKHAELADERSGGVVERHPRGIRVAGLARQRQRLEHQALGLPGVA
jgi:hypothetical protein